MSAEPSPPAPTDDDMIVWARTTIQQGDATTTVPWLAGMWLWHAADQAAAEVVELRAELEQRRVDLCKALAIHPDTSWLDAVKDARSAGAEREARRG